MQKIAILVDNDNFKKVLENSDGIIIFRSELIALELLEAQYQTGAEDIE